MRTNSPTSLLDFIRRRVGVGELDRRRVDWIPYKMEYQQQGSPHIHMLIWLDSAPVFGVDDDAIVTNFIDQIISCKWPLDDLEL